jgi:DsbC/DsbD-like thiol-disulfide interchange protein
VRVNYGELDLVKAFATIVAFVAVTTAATAQAPSPVKWSIQKAPASAQAGQTVTIQLAAQIEKGWHLYALDQPSDGPIPTEISVAPATQFALDTKKIDKPVPAKINDENFGMETHLYSRSVVFGLPVTIASSVPAGERQIEVSARFQACSDKVCLRPTTVTQKATIVVTAAKQ